MRQFVSLLLCTILMLHRYLRAASAFTASNIVRRRPHVVSNKRRALGPIFGTKGIHLTPARRLFSSAANDEFFSNQSFADMGISSPVLLERLAALGFAKPSAVQAATYQAVTERADITIGAETGSGKTLAYLLPLMDDILTSKRDGIPNYDYCRAIILVPNKELVQQVVRMALPLCGGSKALVTGGVPRGLKSNVEETNDPQIMVRLAIMPGGLSAPQDFPPFRNTIGLGGTELPVDIVIATPAALAPLGLKPAHMTMFADIPTLVIDEADMLLDGGYIRPLENVLMGFRRADRLDKDHGVSPTQYIFSAATLPDMGLRSVEAYIKKRFPRATRISMAGMHRARHAGLSEQTLWIQEDSNKARTEELVRLLQLPKEEGGLMGEKCMVFLNSADDVDGANGALERAGVSSVRYHAKVSLEDRNANLESFRSGKIKVLVCTDLASRGLDIPGVTAVVQLQFAGNVVAHLHRMGRCGRAGQRNGRGIIFYPSNQAELTAVVREAESQQERMVLAGDVEEISDDVEGDATTVNAAFSRKRGFTKKLKKARKEEQTDLSE
jgi:superfamily II DNA/RNA helicase